MFHVIFQFLKACKIENGGVALPTSEVPSQGSCPRNMECSDDLHETVYMNMTVDGTNTATELKTYFCKHSDHDAAEINVREILCNRRGPPGHRGGRRKGGRGGRERPERPNRDRDQRQRPNRGRGNGKNGGGRRNRDPINNH